MNQRQNSMSDFESKSYNLTDFEVKYSQRVTFWKIYLVSDFEQKVYAFQIFIQNNCNVSDFERKYLQRVRFWINFFATRQFLKKEYNASEYDLKTFQRAGFQNKILTVGQIFERKFQDDFRFNIEFFSTSQNFNQKYTTCEIANQKLTTIKTLNQSFTCRKWNQKFYEVSTSISKYSQCGNVTYFESKICASDVESKASQHFAIQIKIFTIWQFFGRKALRQ